MKPSSIRALNPLMRLPGIPADIRYTVPAEGMFLWFEIPGGFDAGRMMQADGMVRFARMIERERKRIAA